MISIYSVIIQKKFIVKKVDVPVRFTGQHFTIDKVLINDAIRLANIQGEDLVLDIGAGRGFITVHLVKYSGTVIAIENDGRLVSELRSKFKFNNTVLVVGIDFRQFLMPKKCFKVVSNIPYGITSDIVKKLMFNSLEYFIQGCLVMQLEPARKLVRKQSHNPYVVFYRTFYKLELICEISPDSFMPPPKVKSALLSISKKKNVNNINIEMKERYINFLYFMLKFPGLPVKTALKKIFRKHQVRDLAKKHSLALDNTVGALSPVHFYGCFMEMLELVPEKFYPK